MLVYASTQTMGLFSLLFAAQVHTIWKVVVWFSLLSWWRAAGRVKGSHQRLAQRKHRMGLPICEDGATEVG